MRRAAHAGRFAVGLLVALAVSLGTAPGAAASDWRDRPWTTFEARIGRDRPLAGKLWSTRDAAFLSPEALIAALSRSRYVLLGELHDNPDHHRLQAWIIDRLAAGGGRPGVVMEMITADKTPVLEAYLSRPDASADGLGSALAWDDSGWPDWTIYRPIAEAVLARKLTLSAGDAERTLARKVARGGLAMLDPAQRRQLDLDTALPPALQQALASEIEVSHCGLLPEAALPGMVLAQRLRDATMAQAMRTATASGSAVLIAGAGHVREDRAVPYYLGAEAASVAFMEVDLETSTPEDLAPAGADGTPVVDYIWFTPGIARPDPCEQMRSMMKGASSP